MAYPKMMYHRDYSKHAEPIHDQAIAVRRRAHTCLAVDPDDEAKKHAEGWRNTHDPAAFEDVEGEVPSPRVDDQPNGRRRAKPREIVSTE